VHTQILHFFSNAQNTVLVTAGALLAERLPAASYAFTV